MKNFEELLENLKILEEIISIKFKDKNLLATAFVHSSYVNENKLRISNHYERLEFLGDSVFNLIISDYLFKLFPDYSEGKLSTYRSNIVDSNTCQKFFKKLSLEKFILLGKGEKQNFERSKKNILADAFEALIAVIYLDQGFQSTYDFLVKNFEEDILEISKISISNYKAELQEFIQKKTGERPKYVIVKEIGPEHEKIFHVAVYVEDKEIALGEGVSKKGAEFDAAKKAIKIVKGNSNE